MAGVATQMTIRDGMTSKLNRIFQAVSRTNRALETTDALSDQVNPGANFDRAASAAGRASGQVDNFNNRQRQSEEGARKVASAWGLVKKAIGSALAAISVQKVIELADSMTSTRAGHNERRTSNHGRITVYDYEIRQPVPRRLSNNG